MVGVSVLECLPDGGTQALHFGVPCPVEGRQRLVRVQRIHRCVAGHVQPVDPAHEFAPAKNLPDEALDAGQRRAALPIRLLGGGDDFARIEQFQIHRGAQARVKQIRLREPTAT